MNLRYGLLICMTFCLFLSLRASNHFQKKCLSFKPEAWVGNSSRQVLEYVPAGTTLTFPDNDPTCNRPNQVVVVDLCRVALSISTSYRSGITFEIWLPEKWSSRLLGVGNGGIDGCIKYEDLAYTTQHGFVAFGSNDGHNGTTGVAFYQNPDVVTDFAWRSLHTSVLAGKALAKSFYKKAHHKSYFLGCSLGGRQGIKSSEMFPGDFDGIVAGSPALDFDNLSSWRASFFPITGSVTSPDFISASTWTTLIHNEVLRQCDELDGVTDGIIEDPNLCQFHPETLACENGIVSNCLTPVQVDAVRKIFSPLYGENKELIYPAMQPGSEVLAVKLLYAGKPFSYSEDWFKYVVYTPAWNASTFTIHDAAVAESLNPSNIRTWPDDLSVFRNRGGKILSYHGGQDDKITSFNTERFYNHLSQGMQLSPQDLDRFFRFFRISGMFHCNSGPGAWVVGQGGGAPAAGVPFEAANNVLAAIVDWVERREAPDTIEGTKFVNDVVAQGVAFRRRHCRYPLRNTYVGRGEDPTDPASWKCVREVSQVPRFSMAKPIRLNDIRL